MQYAYDDRSVVVVNSRPAGRTTGLKATARVLDLASKTLFEKSAPVEVGPDGSVKVFQVPEPAGAHSDLLPRARARRRELAAA